MHFNKGDFHHALIMNSDSLDEYLLACLRSALDPSPDTKVFVLHLFSQIRNIFADNDSLPVLKVSCAKFLIYLFSLGDVETLENIEQNIYPIIKQNAMIDRQLPINQRGQKFFILHSQYDNSNQLGKQMMKILGKEYIRFALETVPVWSHQLPTDLEIETKASSYFLGYQQLKKMGVEFPKQEEFVIYTKLKNMERENKIKMLVDRIDSGSMMKNSSLISQRQRQRYNKKRTDSMLLKTLSKLSNSKQAPYQTYLNVPPERQNKTLLTRLTNETVTVSPNQTTTVVHKKMLVTTLPSTQNQYGNQMFVENILETDQFSRSSQGSISRKRQAQHFANLQKSRTLSNQNNIKYTDLQLIKNPVSAGLHKYDQIQSPELYSKPQSPNQLNPNSIQASRVNPNSYAPLNLSPSSQLQLQKAYQIKIAELSNSYKLQLQHTVTSLKNTHIGQMNQFKEMYEQLKLQNTSLRAQISQKNIKLTQYMNTIQSTIQQRNRLRNELTKIVSNQNPSPLRQSKSSQQKSAMQKLLREINRLKIQNSELRSTFLNQCDQQQEFHKQQLKQNKDRIVIFDSQKILYSSSISKLSLEDNLRFKRSILKPKSVLYRNEHLEIGSITYLKQLNIIDIKLFITNTSPHQIHSFRLELKNNSISEDIQFVQKQRPNVILPSKHQEQLHYLCKIRQKNFVIPELSIQYVCQGLPYNILLLFPATKFKLVQPLAHPHMSWYKQQSIQRVLPINQLIFPSISKLKQIFPIIYQGKQSYILPALYLNEQYQFQWKQIDQNNVRLRIVYEMGNQDNAYDLIEEFSFLLAEL